MYEEEKKLRANTNCEKSQVVTKPKLCPSANYNKTQIVTELKW